MKRISWSYHRLLFNSSDTRVFTRSNTKFSSLYNVHLYELSNLIYAANPQVEFEPLADQFDQVSSQIIDPDQCRPVHPENIYYSLLANGARAPLSASIRAYEVWSSRTSSLLAGILFALSSPDLFDASTRGPQWHNMCAELRELRSTTMAWSTSPERHVCGSFGSRASPWHKRAMDFDETPNERHGWYHFLIMLKGGATYEWVVLSSSTWTWVRVGACINWHRFSARDHKSYLLTSGRGEKSSSSNRRFHSLAPEYQK